MQAQSQSPPKQSSKLPSPQTKSCSPSIQWRNFMLWVFLELELQSRESSSSARPWLIRLGPRPPSPAKASWILAYKPAFRTPQKLSPQSRLQHQIPPLILQALSHLCSMSNPLLPQSIWLRSLRQNWLSALRSPMLEKPISQWHFWFPKSLPNWLPHTVHPFRRFTSWHDCICWQKTQCFQLPMASAPPRRDRQRQAWSWLVKSMLRSTLITMPISGPLQSLQRDRSFVYVTCFFIIFLQPFVFHFKLEIIY